MEMQIIYIGFSVVKCPGFYGFWRFSSFFSKHWKYLTSNMYFSAMNQRISKFFFANPILFWRCAGSVLPFYRNCRESNGIFFQSAHTLRGTRFVELAMWGGRVAWEWDCHVHSRASHVRRRFNKGSVLNRCSCFQKWCLAKLRHSALASIFLQKCNLSCLFWS